jgi:type IV pilus assembly protein PilN
MTTTVTAPEPTASALRVPRIAANLLPTEIADARHGRRVKRAVLGALAWVLVLLAAWYGLAVHQASVARAGLAGAQADSQRLIDQQKAYAEVVAVRAQSAAIEKELASLLASDLRWSRLLAPLRRVAPRGVTITSVSGLLSQQAAGAEPQPGVDTTTVGGLQVAGTGPSRSAVAAYVDALARVPGLANPLLGSASLQNGVVQFSVRLDITRAALGGRFSSAAPGAAPAAGAAPAPSGSAAPSAAPAASGSAAQG